MFLLKIFFICSILQEVVFLSCQQLLVFLICRRIEFPKPPPIQEIEMSITPFAEYLHSNLTERLSLQHAIHVNFTKVAIILCLANNFDDFFTAKKKLSLIKSCRVKWQVQNYEILLKTSLPGASRPYVTFKNI